MLVVVVVGWIVVFDEFGDYFIADAIENRIYKVNSQTNQRYEVVGNGSLCYFENSNECGDGEQEGQISFGYIRAIALDGLGNLYVADSGNQRIRKIKLGDPGDWTNVCDAAGDGLVSETIIGNGQNCPDSDCVAGREGQNASLQNLENLAVDSQGNLYIIDGSKIRPIEIFINSKDLTRAPEYVVLTRLVSAIFRRSNDPMFILEELQGIFDPNGGTFKEGKYYHSFYAEIADVIERFFFDVGILERPDMRPMEDNGPASSSKIVFARDEGNAGNAAFRICKECKNRTLKTENGCDICMSPECGYSKCDK